MNVKIIRGTNQIGGCITEISTKTNRIIIDAGEELGSVKSKKVKETNPNIAGLTIGTKKYDAVFFTHYHGDHLGLHEYILNDIPKYINMITCKMYNMYLGVTRGRKILNANFFEFGKQTIIGDIKITPIIADHSAYNSAMFVIEADGKKILHTGDFRTTGYKGKKQLERIRRYGKFDCLICEGTNIARSNKNIIETEKELTNECSNIFAKYNQVFVLSASTNIDRVCSLYKASAQTNKLFIQDVYLANVTKMLAVDKKDCTKIPNPVTFKNIKVYIPNRNKDFPEKYTNWIDKYTITENDLDKPYVLMLRSNYVEYIQELYNKRKLDNPVFIYSMWNGYKETDKMKDDLKIIADMNIPIMDIHTSGHARRKDIDDLIKITQCDMLIPIHTEHRDEFINLYKEAIYLMDNINVEV